MSDHPKNQAAAAHGGLDINHGYADLSGYRMPAEWEEQECVWVTEPHNTGTWPGCFEQAQDQHAGMREALAQHVRVRTTQELGLSTDDSWIRDYGPVFVVNGMGQVGCHDFVFNCWGGKYQPYDRDDRVPREIARRLGLPVRAHLMVLEGGSIEVNGAGTVMTTEQCLLDAQRNPGWSRDRIEQELHQALGTRHVIWLPGGIEGDDTDGHIDDVARFISSAVVVAVRAPPGHPDHEVLERNWAALGESRDQDGRRLERVELPVPDPIYYDFPADEYGPGGRRAVPASYANFLLSNGAVFVPVFGQSHDDRALRVLETALPNRRVVPVRAEHLVVGLGAVHCLTMQQPKGGAP